MQMEDEKSLKQEQNDNEEIANDHKENLNGNTKITSQQHNKSQHFIIKRKGKPLKKIYV